MSSALLFGNAIGKSFEQLLLNKDLRGAQELFLRNWTTQEINGKMEDIQTYPHIYYFKSDTDTDLGETPWLALKEKGMLMLKSFSINLLPLIEHVYSTEEKVELSSGDDVSVGFADAVVKIKGYDRPIILDFKTAGRKYEQDSVIKSEQLSQYLYTLGEKYETTWAGYAVFLKNINKNRTKICKTCGYDGSGRKFKTCDNIKQIDIGTGYVEVRCHGEWGETIYPECTMQLIISEIPGEFVLSVVDEIGYINDAINENHVEKNLDVCHNNYGRFCEFINLCHNGDMHGLIKMEKK